jgi:LysR family transcriptional regulator, transcriptional activator of the cysJI operon
VAVAEEGGFSRASARLRMTQPAISYQVKQLEKELDHPLFIRQPRGIALTEAGRILFHHAQELFEVVRRTHNAIGRLSDGVNGEVRIGTINSIGIYFLPEILQTVREKYPGARPTIIYRDSVEILDALASNEIDMVLMANPGADTRFDYEKILTESVFLVCGRSHPFFRRKRIAPDELKGMDFISLTSRNPTGKLIRDHLSELGVYVEPVVSTDNAETVKKMVDIGLGTAFLPKMVATRDVCEGSLARVELDPPLMREIVLVTWKKLELSLAAAAFVSELREFAATWDGAKEVAE